MDERIKQIWFHYGRVNQLEKALEELEELRVEIAKFLKFVKETDNRFTPANRSENNFLKDKVAEEAADVSIMLEQLIFGLNIKARFEAWRDFKLERQIGRMNNEKS